MAICSKRLPKKMGETEAGFTENGSVTPDFARLSVRLTDDTCRDREEQTRVCFLFPLVTIQ